MWVLGIEPRSFARAARILNHWAISSTPCIFSKYVWKLLKQERRKKITKNWYPRLNCFLKKFKVNHTHPDISPTGISEKATTWSCMLWGVLGWHWGLLLTLTEGQRAYVLQPAATPSQGQTVCQDSIASPCRKTYLWGSVWVYTPRCYHVFILYIFVL